MLCKQNIFMRKNFEKKIRDELENVLIHFPENSFNFLNLRTLLAHDITYKPTPISFLKI